MRYHDQVVDDVVSQRRRGWSWALVHQFLFRADHLRFRNPWFCFELYYAFVHQLGMPCCEAEDVLRQWFAEDVLRRASEL